MTAPPGDLGQHWLRARLPQPAPALLAACVFVKAEGAREAKGVVVKGGEDEEKG